MADNTTLKEKSLPMPITQRAIKTAQQFAAGQPNPQKAEQIYLNTLAVWAVNDYLQLMEIDTDLTHSDSWNPLVRIFADVADLKVRGNGSLECRPLRVGCITPICKIPPEVWDERIGYVVVEIDETRLEATLLGFSQTALAGELSLSHLESMDALLEHLQHPAEETVNLSQWFGNVFKTGWQEVESLFAPSPKNAAANNSSDSQMNLGQWFQNIFDAGWQAVSDLLNPESQLQFRGAAGQKQRPVSAFGKGKAGGQLFPEADVMRAKLIDLGMQLGNKTIALVIALTQEADRKVNIVVQVHPTGGEIYLPTHLKLILLSESGETLQEVESRSQDLCMQLRQFKVPPDTGFRIQVILDDVSITEAFTI